MKNKHLYIVQLTDSAYSLFTNDNKYI